MLKTAHGIKDDIVLEKNEEWVNDTIVCKNCKQDKLLMMVVGGAKKTVRVICNCDSERIALEKKQKAFEKRQEHFKMQQRNSLLSERYFNVSFENIDLDISDSFKIAYEKVKSFSNNWNNLKNKPVGIYLHGHEGVGKTLLTACLGNELMFNQYATVQFTSIATIEKELLSARRTFDDNEEKRIWASIENIDLLIIDDLGAENTTKNNELVYSIINTRYNANRPMLFSSNLPLREINKIYGTRIAARIAELSTYQLEIIAESYRPKNRNKNKDLF